METVRCAKVLVSMKSDHGLVGWGRAGGVGVPDEVRAIGMVLVIDEAEVLKVADEVQVVKMVGEVMEAGSGYGWPSGVADGRLARVVGEGSGGRLAVAGRRSGGRRSGGRRSGGRLARVVGGRLATVVGGRLAVAGRRSGGRRSGGRRSGGRLARVVGGRSAA
jgi:hypothetical protein